MKVKDAGYKMQDLECIKAKEALTSDKYNVKAETREMMESALSWIIPQEKSEGSLHD